MPEFDYQAAIKELAEAEMMPVLGLAYPNNTVVNTETGCIVPFVSLRVVKQGVWSHADCAGMGICQNLLANNSPVPPTSDCQGRGWIPEPDVEKACWRVIRRIDVVSQREWVAFWSKVNEIVNSPSSLEEAVLRAALAWLEEQHD